MNTKEYSFNTRVIHAGHQDVDPAYGSVMPPIYQTSTYKQSSPGVHKGHEYARSSNPTRTALEQSLASLENAAHAISFSSGVAAIDAVLKLLQPGDQVIATQDLYGGSYRLFVQLYEKFGIQFHFVDMGNPANILPYVNANTKLIWVETPTNPLLNIIDIAAVVAVAKAHQILVAVDNTFATPYLQQPLSLGVDIVMHSATKYLGGHSDVIMGALMVNDEQLAQQLYFIQKASGAIPGPQDCYLVIRGIKTLHVRMDRHNENTAVVARFLKGHKAVGQVYWPGFSNHPNHEIATRQMKNYGGMLSFTTTTGTDQSARDILEKVQIFTLAESLGGVESLIGHPVSMSHASMSDELLLKTGVTSSLIRVSVGIEDVQDLIIDLDQALS